MPATSVLAHSNGRLSHFKSLLTDIHDPCSSVKKFIICLSSLDRDNTLHTNSSTLKSLLGAAHRVFPNATLAVQLAGIADSYNAAQKLNLQGLNSFVLNKSPSSCCHIPNATTFTLSPTGLLWDESTRSLTLQALRAFLQ